MALSILKKIIQNRICLHILFWCISVFAFGYIFKISNQLEHIDIYFSILFHLSIILGVYLNLYLSVPLLLNKKHHILYGLNLTLLTLLIAYLNQLTFIYLANIVLPDYYFVLQFNFPETSLIVGLFLLGSTFLSLSMSWFKLQEANRRLIEIEKENMSSQLQALQSQINPHFLFNSLNVLYSLTLKQSGDTADAIIKLSDILRYVIYDSNKDSVPIESEIKLVNDYLSLQQHRIDNSSIVSFDTDISDHVKVPPMLILPLVENSFKHGVKGDIANTYVDMKLTASNEMMQFEIINNKGVSDNPTGESESGIGLSNIKKRLELLYPDKHQFLCKDEGKQL